ncbi:MAG: hypothetical protein WCX65_10805 [bacterium]
MHEDILMRTAISTVPHWYESEYAKNTYELTLNKTTLKFCCHNPITPKLHMLHTYMQNSLDLWRSQMPVFPTPRSLQQVEENVAVRWLEICDSSINWDKFISYIEFVRLRTYENDSVALNLVIGSGESSMSLMDDNIQKILDPLAASQQVYFRVDKDLRFIDYQEILWREVREASEYKFIPSFLEPFASILQDGEFSAHLHRRGDIFIMDSHGLLAANRKGHWHIYDANTFKNSVCGIMGNITVGNNVFELIFDLSYQRRGALLVYDPQHKVIDHVVNPQSVIGGGSPSPDAARAMLSPVIRGIRLGKTDRLIRKKNIFLEIAVLDGAVIFDDEELLAVGAMIKQHPELGDCIGARTTATQSAYRYGGIPVKVSADGDIHILFESSDNEGCASDAELTFM